MNKTLFTLIAVVVLFSCKKGKTNPSAGNKIYFTGITKTDLSGVIISADITDWKTTDVWVKQELDLFTSTYQTTCTPSYNYQIIAYPNPCNGIFSLYIDKKPSTRIELRLVDENFNKVVSNDSVTQNHIQINAGSIKDTVRLYYKFVDSNCEFKGHGDILIQ